MPQFTINNTPVQNIMSWIKSGEVSIPEIQRPFVWNATDVRNLLDSLYKGFPVGYLTIWKNPNAKLKNGGVSEGKKILIDGQQRISALQTALVGEKIVDSCYAKRRISISFNPITESFEVLNPAISKDSKWISDIAVVFEPTFDLWAFTEQFCRSNNLIGQEHQISSSIVKLIAIQNVPFGVIELNSSLGIEDVTDIFIRINSEGVSLSQADFAMSKIAADDKYGGSDIRKTVDYFCHLLQKPEDYEKIVSNDKELEGADILAKMTWVLQEQNNIYIPTYADVLRVAFTYKFKRGKIADLVSLLSGRDFETKEYLSEIAEKSFLLLKEGVDAFVNQTNFKRYLMLIQSIGIIDPSLIRSQNVLNFGYILFLSLREKNIESAIIEKVVRKWIVLSILTSRYSGSPESTFDYDIKRFTEQDPLDFLSRTENGELSEAFWAHTLVDHLDTAVASSPFFNVFLMAQIVNRSRGFLSPQIEIRSLIEQRGDIHHLFPKEYLKKNGVKNRKDYNQIANYAYTQTEINIKIKDNSPLDYMQKSSTSNSFLGGINTEEDLTKNLQENCIPEDFVTMRVEDYSLFLKKRRELMAQFIKNYYQQLG